MLRRSFFLLLVLLGSPGCYSTAIEPTPLPIGAKRPLDAPNFILFDGTVRGRPFVDGSWAMDVVLEGASYLPIATKYSGQGTAFVMRFRPRSPGKIALNLLKRSYSLALVVPRAMLPRLATGMRYRLEYTQRPATEGRMGAVGLRILDKGGRPVYVASIGDSISPDNMPDGVVLTPTEKKAFVTTALTPAGCQVRRQHNFARLSAGSLALEIPPGEHRIVAVGESEYVVRLLDFHSLLSGDACGSVVSGGYAYTVELLRR